MPVIHRARGTALGLALTAAIAGSPAAGQNSLGGADLFEMSLEELSSLPVVSMYRRAQTLDETAASIYVITADDIKRSGVRSLPEALRLAPGVEVARNGASDWTISVRGFNSNLSNKLLVLIDGRSVYSPLFAGVYWDVQDTLLEDVDRIEVISGPGGSVWGANAVNGVINIITRSAEATHGGFVELGGGNEHRGFAGLRYGAPVGENVDMRAYVKYRERDATETLSGTDAFDDWRMAQAGFNIRWAASDVDAVTVRGDVYDADESALLRGDFTLGTLPDFEVPGQVDVAGHNVVARWRRTLDGDASLRLQFYYDHTQRDIPGSFNEARDTYDLDFQHDLARAGRHTLAWGAALRVTSDDIGNTLFATFEPASRTDRTLSAFLQDRIRLADDRLELTVGTKLEHNDYSGFEHQPSVRMSWLAREDRTVWAAVSRAVRTPARLNTDLHLTAPLAGLDVPLYFSVRGSPDYESEELIAYEAGYRFQVADRLSFDLAAFDNHYDELQTQEFEDAPFVVPGPPTYIVLPAALRNRMEGESYGATFVTNWQPLARWRLRFLYSRLEIDLEIEPGSTDVNAPNLAGNSPDHQLGLQSYVELPRNLSLYTGARYVDDLPAAGVPSYFAVDMNLDWQVSDTLSAALTVQNLNDRRHIEFGNGTYIERGAYLSVEWTF